MKKNLFKYLFLFWMGGSIYLEMELVFRGYSYWPMFCLGGLCFIICGLMNEYTEWHIGLIKQIATGTVIVTLFEFVVGYVSRYCFHFEMWNYDNMPGNICGVICPQFIVLWIPLVVIAIMLDDVVRWKFFQEDTPRYWIGNRVFFPFS